MIRRLIILLLIVGCYQPKTILPDIERKSPDIERKSYVYKIGMSLDEFEKINMNPNIYYEKDEPSNKKEFTIIYEDPFHIVYRQPINWEDIFGGGTTTFIHFQNNILVRTFKDDFKKKIEYLPPPMVKPKEEESSKFKKI